MIYIGPAIVALIIFYYLNWHLKNKREERRDLYRERREEQLQRLLESKKKLNENDNSNLEN